MPTPTPTWRARPGSERGQRDAPRGATNARIASYFRDVGHAQIADDDTAWCAAFLGAQLERAGIRSTRSLRARSYVGWGVEAQTPEPGTIAVFARGSDPALGHVGFVVAATPTRIILLGGNQSNAVTVEAFDRRRLLALRLPHAIPTASSPVAPTTPPPSSPRADIFDAALAHILRQEGGWSDDPFDPGGATNKGITIGVYAREKHVEVTADTIDALKAELRRIPEALVRRIYLERYWKPARCPELPAPLALFHVDTAVNMGVGTAARLLQQALGVAIDGEIGPETLAAARIAPLPEALARYADLRRARYRSLSHFWRFGRGWLARVDATFVAARNLAGDTAQPPPSIPPERTSPQPQELPMSFDPATLPSPAKSTRDAATAPGKWWGESLTIWGTILTTVTTVAPVIFAVFGIDMPASLIQQLGRDAVIAAQAIGGLIGTVMTIAGRVRAEQRLITRPLTLRL